MAWCNSIWSTYTSEGSSVKGACMSIWFNPTCTGSLYPNLYCAWAFNSTSVEEGAVHKYKSTVPYWPCTRLWRKPRRRRVLIQVKNTTNPPPHLYDFATSHCTKTKHIISMTITQSGRHNTMQLYCDTHFCPPQDSNLERRLIYVINRTANNIGQAPRNEQLTDSYKYKHARCTKGENAPYDVGQIVTVRGLVFTVLDRLCSQPSLLFSMYRTLLTRG
jgi:hypothetical protein